MADNINADAQAAEPSVSPNTTAARDFMAGVLGGIQTGEPQPAVPQPVPIPPATGPVPQPVPIPPATGPAPQPVPIPPAAGPAPQPVPIPPAAVPAPQPVPVPPAAVPAPFAVDYAQRYAPPGAPQLDLAPLPDLPPEPQLPQVQDGQQIPNAAFAAMRSNYGQMRHLADDYRSKYNRLVEDTKKFQGEKTEFAAQLNAKDEEIKKLQDELGRSDLSKSPEFRAQYDAPLIAATDKVVETLVANGMQQNDAVSLAKSVISASPDERPEMLSGLPTHVQGMIMIKTQETDQLWNARDQALENWKQSAEGLAAVAARGSAIVDAQRTQRLAESAIGLVKGLPPEKGLPPAFQVTDPAFVADRDAKEQQFRAWVQQAPDDQKMAAMFEGFMAPKTYEMVDNVFRENIQLKQMLYARTRVDAPPIAAMRMPAPALRPGTVAPQVPQPPPQAPTVQRNGWSYASSGSDAQAFAQQIMNGMQGQRNLPVL